MGGSVSWFLPVAAPACWGRRPDDPAGVDDGGGPDPGEWKVVDSGYIVAAGWEYKVGPRVVAGPAVRVN